MGELRSSRGAGTAACRADAPIVGKDGVLYGTTMVGGYGEGGTVYSLTPPSAPGGAWTEQVLFDNFSMATGIGPAALVGRGGVLYGTTSAYGPSTCECGTIFSLTPGTFGAPWTLQVLYTFQGSATDGYSPYFLIDGNDGMLYGLTTAATFYGSYVDGTVFSLTPPASPGGAWTEQLVWAFTGGNDGDAPSAIVLDGGKLAGTASAGGEFDFGTIFELLPPSAPGGAWSENTLYTFQGFNDGASPVGLIHVGALLYGVSVQGSPIDGSVFQFTP